MSHRAQKYIEEIKEWLKDHDVETVELSEEMKELFKEDLVRVFIKSVVLSHVTEVYIFEELGYMLKNKDEEIAKIVNELNELEIEESGEVTLDDLMSQEIEKE